LKRVEALVRSPSPNDSTRYDWWRAALVYGAGSNTAPIHADDPQCGRFKVRRHRNGPWLPVAIFPAEPIVDPETGELTDDEKLICLYGFHDKQEPVDAYAMWTWVAGHPISEGLYEKVFETGKWPDGARGLGDNQPPASDDLESLKAQIETVLDLVRALPAEITDQQTADLAANYRDRLNALHKQAEAASDVEKRPHHEAWKAAIARWAPVLEIAEHGNTFIRRLLTPFLNRAEEEKRKAAAAQIMAGTAPATIDTRARAGGAHGKRAALRTVIDIEVTDYAAALAYLSGSDEVKTAVESVARRMARAGIETPGIKIIKTKVAA